MPSRVSSPATAAGFSIAETLVALSLIAVTSAALLPAIVAAGRLQRDSARETGAVRIAASRIEGLLSTGAAAVPGGSLDESLAGFSQATDSAGAPVAAERAEYDCRWRVSHGIVVIVAVRVVARGGGDVTLSTAVPRE
ncbi:MAG: type II secretion system protein [Acidobacteria bacterium]|nr:type II secretion system protein [Acidobacteriota bacterium]